METHKTLAHAMLAVMRAVPYVQKEGKMQGGGSYKYAGEADIINALHGPMCEAALTFSPVNIVVIGQEQYQTAKGSAMNRVILAVTYRLAHADSKEHMDVMACGEAADSGDKATPKAMTGAYKYALRQAFLIETGDDPDKEVPPPRATASKFGEGYAKTEKPSGGAKPEPTQAQNREIAKWAQTIGAEVVDLDTCNACFRQYLELPEGVVKSAVRKLLAEHAQQQGWGYDRDKKCFVHETQESNR